MVTERGKTERNHFFGQRDHRDSGRLTTRRRASEETADPPGLPLQMNNNCKRISCINQINHFVLAWSLAPLTCTWVRNLAKCWQMSQPISLTSSPNNVFITWSSFFVCDVTLQKEKAPGAASKVSLSPYALRIQYHGTSHPSGCIMIRAVMHDLHVWLAELSYWESHPPSISFFLFMQGITDE